MGRSETIYSLLPVWAQNWACSYYGRREARTRYSPFFHEKLQWLQESQFWSEGDIAAYKDEQVRGIVKHAYETVPYYRRTFDQRKVKPHDIKGVEDLPKVPILTKEEVRANVCHLVSADYRGSRLMRDHTSGTTGTSLQFFREPEAIAFQWAVWWRHKARFHVRFNERSANFSGRPAVPIAQTGPPFWRENSPFNQVVFSMQHNSPEKIGFIVDRLNEEEFAFYTGYPSTLHSFANCVLDAGVQITSRPRYVFTGSENLLEDQRALIARVTGAPVTDQYGFAEGCGNASRCKSDVFHEDFEFGVLECCDPEPLDELGLKRGRIVCTGFAGLAMPFIRYDIGDVAVWDEKPCSCGLHSNVIRRIDGRAEDFILTPEGVRIMRLDHLFKDTQAIKESQVVQCVPGEIDIRVVRRAEYDSKTERMIQSMVRRWVSQTLRVRFVYVDELEREPNGKIRAVKSYLKT